MSNCNDENSVFKMKCVFICLFSVSLGCIISSLSMNIVDDTNILLSEISYGVIGGIYAVLMGLLVLNSKNKTITNNFMNQNKRSIPFIVGIALAIGLEVFAITKQYLVIIKHKKMITSHAKHAKNITKYNTINWLFLSTIILLFIAILRIYHTCKIGGDVLGILALIGILDIVIIILQFQYETFVTTRFTDG
jgi:hypothetical protein